jgi:DNA-binding NarL/FixJ family response regulator
MLTADRKRLWLAKLNGLFSMINQKKTSVLIIEPDFALRDCLQVVIDQDSEFYVCGNYPTFDSTLVKLKQLNPDIVILDIAIGLTASIGVIRKHVATAQILIHGNEQEREPVFRVLSNGAVGFINKGVAPVELIRCLQETRDGGSLLPNKISRMLVERYQWQTIRRLTKAETKTLKHLCMGKTYDEIAGDLGVTRGTIARQLQSTYKKLEVRCRVDAIRQVKYFEL